MDLKKINDGEDFIKDEFTEEFDTGLISFLAIIYLVLMIFTLFFYNQNQF